MPSIFEEGRQALQLAVAAINSDGRRYRLEFDTGLAGVEKCLIRKIDADFVWIVDLMAKKDNNNHLHSECFNVRGERYKMRLSYQEIFYCEYGLSYLCIIVCENDATLRWPFEKRVTISISNRNSPNVYRSITNYCRVGQPNDKDYRGNDTFIFDHSDLTNAGLMQGNHIIVDCIFHDE